MSGDRDVQLTTCFRTTAVGQLKMYSRLPILLSQNCLVLKYGNLSDRIDRLFSGGHDETVSLNRFSTGYDETLGTQKEG